MLAKVSWAAVNGIEAYPVGLEVNAGYGDTIIVIVGLPDAAMKEPRDRVMAALIASGFGFVAGRTTINLAPADVEQAKRISPRSNPRNGSNPPSRDWDTTVKVAL